MGDKYANFAELKKGEPHSYRIRSMPAISVTVVIAPHGGGTEPGTSEIAEAIAGKDYSFYAFEGIKNDGNRSLHITSTHFDEPTCLALISKADRVLAIHGEEEEEGEAIYLGGRDEACINRMRETLVRHGFRVEKRAKPGLEGIEPMNICNRNKVGAGAQIELTNGYRRSFFRSLSRAGRNEPQPRFYEFVNAIREALQ
jgi:phage replication-related protein YjqB (UPF0714/DUF867 family)